MRAGDRVRAGFEGIVVRTTPDGSLTILADDGGAVWTIGPGPVVTIPAGATVTMRKGPHADPE